MLTGIYQQPNNTIHVSHYLLLMTTTTQVMQALLATADKNLKSNLREVNLLGDGKGLANAYLDQYASAIAMNLTSVEDLDELDSALRFQVIGNEFVHRICEAYREEIARMKEIKAEELVKSFIAEETTTTPEKS